MEYEQNDNSDYDYFYKEISNLKAKNKELEEGIALKDFMITEHTQYAYEITQSNLELLDALEELCGMAKNMSNQIDSLNCESHGDISHLQSFLDLITKYRG